MRLAVESRAFMRRSVVDSVRNVFEGPQRLLAAYTRVTMSKDINHSCCQQSPNSSCRVSLPMIALKAVYLRADQSVQSLQADASSQIRLYIAF